MPTFTREQFYERVWSTSAVQLAKELGVSDVAIAKVCEKYNIPKPSLGYWAKLQHGKKVKKPPLPKLADPKSQTISLNAQSSRWTLLSDEAKAKLRAQKREDHKVVVPEKLDTPHPLVERTERSLRSSAADNEGLVRPKAKGCLHVAVGTETIDRAMRIMDALLKAIEERGMRVTVKDQEYRSKTLVEVDGEEIDVRLMEVIGESARQPTAEERLQEQRYPSLYGGRKYVRRFLTAQLGISVDARFRSNRRKWSEKDGKRLEDRLNTVIAFMFRTAEVIKERRRRYAEQERQWEEARRLREEAERRRRKREQRIERLQKDAAAWHKATRIRRYIDAVEAAARADGRTIDETGSLHHWIQWARRHAEKIDPLTRRKRLLCTHQQKRQ